MGQLRREIKDCAHVPARNVLSRSGSVLRGKFPSRKNGRMIAYEQLLEADALVLFEMQPSITTYCEQPCTISSEAPLWRYTPDFELRLRDGRSVLIEVKPCAKLDRPEIADQIAKVKQWLVREGRELCVLTDREIRQEPRLDILRSLQRHLPPLAPSDRHIDHALSTLRRDQVRTLAQSHACVGPELTAVLFARGYLQCDLQVPLCRDSIVRYDVEARHDWFLISQGYGF